MLLQNDSRKTAGPLPAACLLLMAIALQLAGCRGVPPRPPPLPASLEGRVQLPPREEAESDAVIVFLEPFAEPPAPAVLPTLTVPVEEGAFSSEILVVAAGQQVELRSEGELFHHYFSYALGNAFDLGAGNQERRNLVTLEHPGIVHFYCTLHPSEGGVIFVVPSPYFAVPAADGAWQIGGIPPGPYALKTWSAGSSETHRTLTLAPGSVERVELRPGSDRAVE